MKKQLDLISLTQEQIRMENREFNPSSWDNVIDRFSKYGNVSFYVARKQKGFDYDRYFVSYTLDSGLKLFNTVCYSSSITSNGFLIIYVTMPDQDNKCEMFSILLKDASGREGRCENNEAERAIMTRNSINHGVIFSNRF